MSERGGDSGRTSTRRTSKGHIRGNQKKRGGNHRKPRKRPLKKRKTNKEKSEKKDGKKIMKKPLLTTYLCRKNPLFFHFIVVPALSPSLPLLLPPYSPPCLASLPSVLYSFPPPSLSPRTVIHPFLTYPPTHLPTLYPYLFPYHPLMLYYTIPSHSIFRSVLLYISFLKTTGRERKKMYVCIESY